MRKNKKIKLTKEMTFNEACRALNIDERNIPALHQMFVTRSREELNHADQFRALTGHDNYQKLRKWLYNA